VKTPVCGCALSERTRPRFVASTAHAQTLFIAAYGNRL
jgi:hypothetical protein